MGEDNNCGGGQQPTSREGDEGGGSVRFQLSLTASKKKQQQQHNNKKSSQQLLLGDGGLDHGAFGDAQSSDATQRRAVSSFSQEEETKREQEEELPVIPVAPNRFQRKKTADTTPITSSHDYRSVPEAVGSDHPGELPPPLPPPLTVSRDEPRPPTPPPSSFSSSSISLRVDEAQQYRRELDALPDAMNPDDYSKPGSVPLEQFGAALLRGMGWKGNDKDVANGGSGKGADAEMAMPRPHRLGLGAIPRAEAVVSLPSSSNGRRTRRPDQLEQDQRRQLQLREYERQREEQRARDRQITVQDGSVVWINLPGRGGTTTPQPRRARIAQWAGVPGLNRIRIQLEERGEVIVVSRSDVGQLVSRDELDRNPFQEPPVQAPIPSRDERSEGKNEGRDVDRTRSRQERRRTDDQSSRERRRDDVDDNDRGEGESRKRRREISEPDTDSRGRRHRRRERSPDREPSGGRDGSGSDAASDDRRHRKRREARKGSEPRSGSDRDPERRHASSNRRRTPDRGGPSSDDHPDAWLIPHIRVRVVTSKLGRHHFQQKGVVVDVTPKGATLRMDGGSSSSAVVLDGIPARYLTTALPKVEGCAVVVQGPHKGAKGVVLQRQSNQAVLQLDEDHTLLTLSPDDLAEWCGPRDTDYTY